MSDMDPMGPDAGVIDSDDHDVPWEVPEVIAAIVLVAVGVIAAGGLIGALIFANSAEVPGGFSSQTTWTAVERGAAWSGPLITMVLLGVMGTTWFQTRSWIDSSNSRFETAQIPAHLRRTVRIAGWTVVGLVLSVLGAVANVASAIGLYWSYHSASFGASVAIPVGASALAVLLLTGAGIWTYVRIRRIATA